jgi:hypothetical protein
VGIGGKPFATEFLGNDQGEEAMFLDVGPGGGRQVHVLADLPITDHGTEFFGRTVEKGLFFFGECGFGISQQLVPVRSATKQFAIPPDGAGIDGIAFGFGHGGQHILEPAKERGAEIAATQVRQEQGRCHRGQQ